MTGQGLPSVLRLMFRRASFLRVLVAEAALLMSGAHAWGQCPAQWLPGDGEPGISGTAYAATVWDQDGNGPREPVLVVGGTFSLAGKAIVKNIASWDGAGWSTIGTGLPERTAFESNTGVLALTVFNGELIASGAWDPAKGAPVGNIARWNGVSWLPLGVGMGGASPATVFAMTVYKGELIAAGNFFSAGSVAANNIARWDGSSWRPLGAGMNGYVYTLKVIGDDLFVGGDFSYVYGLGECQRVARWDGALWHALGTGMNGIVRAIEEYGGFPIAAGDFTAADGHPVGHVSQWTGSAWQGVGSGVSTTVSNLGGYGGELIADKMRWNGISWRAFETSTISPSRPLCNFRGELIGTGGAGVIRWDGSDGLPLGSGFNGSVSRFVEFEGSLIGAGSFTAVGGATAKRVAVCDAGKWRRLGDGMNSSVQDLAIHDSKLIAAGDFTTAGGQPAGRVARWDGTAWRALGTGFNKAVHALTDFNGELIAAGEFTTADGLPSGRIARWDGSAWRDMSNGLPGQSTSVVHTLLVYNGDLLAGGYAGSGTQQAIISRWNGSTWITIGSGIAGQVWALSEYGGNLVASGHFTVAGGTSANNIAMWDGSAWHSLGSGLTGSPSGFVYALTVYDNKLVVGGINFTHAGDASVFNLAVWDGSAWGALGSGVSFDLVSGLTSFGGELLASGSYSIISVSAPAGFARWAVPIAPSVLSEPESMSTCLRGSASFIVPSAGTAPLTYRWRRNGINLSDGSTGSGSSIFGSGAAVLHVSSATSSDAGSYDCVISNVCDTVTSGAAALRVCAADVDCNGYVNGIDFDGFVSAFEGGEAGADIDHDGFVNGIDFDVFTAAFEAGC